MWMRVWETVFFCGVSFNHNQQLGAAWVAKGIVYLHSAIISLVGWFFFPGLWLSLRLRIYVLQYFSVQLMILHWKKEALTECICYLIGLNAQIEWKTINFWPVKMVKKKLFAVAVQCRACTAVKEFSVIGIPKWKLKCRKIKVLNCCPWLLLSMMNLNARTYSVRSRTLLVCGKIECGALKCMIALY